MKLTLNDFNRTIAFKAITEAPNGWQVEIKEAPRTLSQNALIHPVARQIQQYMEAHGAPARSEEWWRYYLLGKWQGHEITPDPDGSGGFVVINKSCGTSGLSKAEASEFTEFLYAFGTNIGVRFETNET